MKLRRLLAIVLAFTMVLSTMGTAVFAEEDVVPDKGYMLYIYNADGTVGYKIDGTKSASEFSLCSAIADARVFVDNAFLFGITTPATYVVEMYEDSKEDESFEIGSDVTVNGNGHNIVLAEGVVLTNNGTINNATIVEATPAATVVATVNGEDFTDLQTALDAAAAGEGNVKVEILEDINLTNVDWNPVSVSAPKYPVVTVNGNGKIITGLNDMLFAGTWAGGSGLIINDLTIADSAIVNDKDDTKGTVGVGAFIGFPQASATVTLNNCHLVNSRVEGGHWTGGLIGYAAGYAGNDGPVFMNLTINKCSVTNSTITGKGSAGGIIGHATGNAWTQVTITDTTVFENTVASTGSSTNKAGAVIGTIGAAGQATTVNGVEKTGGVSVAATVSGNNVTSNSETITTIYGRQGTDTGMLYVTGGKYDNYPIEENVAYAAPIEGYEIADNGDGTWGIAEEIILSSVATVNGIGYETIQAAIDAAQDGDTVTIKEGTYALPSLKAGITVEGEGEVILEGTLSGTLEDLTLKNLYIKGANSQRWGYAKGDLVFENVTFEATSVYAIHFDGITEGSTLLYKDCTIIGWVAMSGSPESCVFDGCTIKDNGAYGVIRTYFDAEIKDCTFDVDGANPDDNYQDGVHAVGATVKVDNCTNLNGDIKDILNISRDAYIYVDDVLVCAPAVAQIGETKYSTIADALAAAQAGDEIVLLADVEGGITVPAGVIFNGNGFDVSGGIIADGDITFKGITKAKDFDVNYTGTTINIGSGASLELTGTDRLVVGHGCTFNIEGTITDAKNADKASLTPSLIMPGASFTGAGVNFNVKNAYISVPSSYCSSSKSASGTFNFNIENSIWDVATNKLAFEAQSTAATVNFDLKDSVLTTASHLVFGVDKGEIVIDNSNVNVGTSRQLENRSTMTIKNGSVVNGAVATSSNAINPGTVIVENATYAVSGQFSGAAVGTGTLVIKKGANVSVGSIVDNANIVVDATGMAAGDTVDITANLSNFTGTVSVINNNLGAKIENNKIILYTKPVAKIGETGYATLEEAFKAATDGCTIEILSDVVIDYKWDCRDYVANGSHSQFKESVTINGNNHTIKFTDTVSDSNWNTIFRFEENAIVKNLTIDISEATGAQRVVSAKKSLDVDNLTIVGSAKYGIVFGEGASAADLENTEISIKNSNLNGTRRAISDNEGGKDVRSVVITNNTLNANVCVSAFESITFNDNTATGDVDLRAYTKGNALNVTAKENTLNTEKKNYIDANGTIDAQEEFVIAAKGSNSPAYTKEVDGYVRVWGEGGGNAKESFVLKLYSDETLMATTQLNNVDGIIDGDVFVTWNFFYPESNDEYWTTTWEQGHPNPDAAPTKVELYIDGTLVATTEAQMNGADGINPVVWSELGGVARAVAKIGETGYATLQAAIDAAVDGDTIVIVADITGDVTVAADDNLVLDLNGFDIVGEMTGITNNGTLIINDSVGTGNVYTTNVEDQGRPAIYNKGNVTINGGWFGDSNNDTTDRNAINRGNAVKNEGTAVINGGYFTNVSNQYIGTDAYAYAINTLEGGKTTINNAIVYGDVNGLVYSAGTTVVEDGSYTLGRPGEENNLWYLAYGDVEIKGGTWTRAFAVPSWNTGNPTVYGDVEVSGGTFSVEIPEANIADDYAALADLNGNYIVGKKPTATVNNLGMQTVPAGDYMVYGSGSNTEDMPLSFVMQFVADQTEADMATSPYADWYGDFVITFTGIEDGSFIADGCYLAGHYGSFGWVKVPVDGMEIEEGERYPVMLGVGMGQKYDYICSSVQDFKCALYLTPEILEANPNLKVNLELAVVDNSKGSDAAASALVNNENTYKVVDYTYDADDFVVANYVAQVGETKYTTLAEAIAVGGDVVLLADVELENTITVKNDVSLDLNGNTISGVCNAGQAHMFMVNNGAQMTIKDSSDAETGKITYDGTNATGWIVDVEGKLVLESGTLELTGSWSIGYAVDVRPNAWGNAYTESTTFVMNGGNIVSSGAAVRVASSSSDTYKDVSASFTMNGGEIDAAWDGVFVQQSNAAWDLLSFIMNDGTIESDLNPVRLYGPAATSYVNGEDCVDIALNGGTLTYTGTEAREWLVDGILCIGGDATADEFLKDATVTASATFARNNVADGYTWVESDGVYTLEKVKLFSLAQITASLDSSLALNIYYNLSDLTGEGYKAVIEHTKEDGSVVTTTIPYSEWVKSKTMIAVRYTGMAAKQMTDRIKITIYNADGTQASESYETSFRDYAIGSLKQYSENDAYAKYLPVFIDMLNYGAAAQKKFGYNTSNLANAGTDEFQQHATKEYTITDKEWQFDGECFYAITVSLENTLELNTYFNEAKDGMYAKYSYTTHSGKQIEGRVEYGSFISGWNHLGIAVPVAIADADALVTVDLYNSDDEKVGTTVYSVDGYLKGMINQNEPGEIYEALAKFAASAKTAFVTK